MRKCTVTIKWYQKLSQGTTKHVYEVSKEGEDHMSRFMEDDICIIDKDPICFLYVYLRTRINKE